MARRVDERVEVAYLLGRLRCARAASTAWSLAPDPHPYGAPARVAGGIGRGHGDADAGGAPRAVERAADPRGCAWTDLQAQADAAAGGQRAAHRRGVRGCGRGGAPASAAEEDAALRPDAARLVGGDPHRNETLAQDALSRRGAEREARAAAVSGRAAGR